MFLGLHWKKLLMAVAGFVLHGANGIAKGLATGSSWTAALWGLWEGLTGAALWQAAYCTGGASCYSAKYFAFFAPGGPGVLPWWKVFLAKVVGVAAKVGGVFSAPFRWAFGWIFGL